ncbi:MAG: tagU [Firmicutes bacterium]|nr:tagU [Bacillota bacterium]
MRCESYRSVPRRKVRWLRVLLVLFLFILMLVAMTGVAVYAYNNLFNTTAASSGVPGSNADNTINKRINILILGVDDGDVDNPGAPKRSDTMIVASINPQDSTVNMLSIPRDTRVIIPGHRGYDKITHAFAYGGAALSVRTVQEFLHIPINYYAVLDWQGFIDAVDVLGGVDLYVENDMDYDDPYANLSIHLSKGLQHLDGLSAGEYVRFRHDELGDIGRVQRQQRFLKALRDEMFSFGTILKLPALTSTLRQYVTTDMPKLTMIKLANTLIGMKDASNFHTELLPGDFSAKDSFGYWVPDSDRTKKMVEAMFLNAEDLTAKQTSVSSK